MSGVNGLGYQLALFVHVLAAMIWVGTMAALQALVLRAERSGDAQRLVVMAREAEWLGTRVIIPVSLVLLIAGGWMIWAGPHSIGEPWLIAGILAYLASALIGAFYLGPQGRRLRALIDEHGAGSEPVRSQLRRIFLVSRLELAVLIAVVLDMVVKPGTPIAAALT